MRIQKRISLFLKPLGTRKFYMKSGKMSKYIYFLFSPESLLFIIDRKAISLSNSEILTNTSYIGRSSIEAPGLILGSVDDTDSFSQNQKRKIQRNLH